MFIKNKSKTLFIIKSGAERDRTDDLFNAIEALSQLSYSPISFKFYLGPSTKPDSDIFLEAKLRGAFTSASTDIIA